MTSTTAKGMTMSRKTLQRLDQKEPGPRNRRLSSISAANVARQSSSIAPEAAGGSRGRPLSGTASPLGPVQLRIVGE